MAPRVIAKHNLQHERPIPSHSVRADFAGGGLSSDLGPVLLRGIDLQIGLTKRIAKALPDRRHQSYVNHSYHDILPQRIYQTGTSCTSFLANCMRLLLHAAAYILHQHLRTQALQHAALSLAQPSTVISKLFRIAVQVRQYKNKTVLHLPSACPVKQLLQTSTERLYLPTPARAFNSS